MAEAPKYKLTDVKSVTFERHFITDDGETVIFEVHDKAGNTGHIAVDWSNFTSMLEVIERGFEHATERRKALQKKPNL